MQVQKVRVEVQAQLKHTSSLSVSFLRCTCRLGRLLQTVPFLGLTELRRPIRRLRLRLLVDGGQRSPRAFSYTGTHTDVSRTFLLNPEQSVSNSKTGGQI